MAIDNVRGSSYSQINPFLFGGARTGAVNTQTTAPQGSGLNGYTSSVNWDGTPAKQVGNGGMYDPSTGGIKGAELDVDNKDLFKTADYKTTDAVNSNKENFFGKAAKNLGKVFVDGEEMTLLQGMELLNQLQKKQNKQENNSVAGFQA